MSDTTPEDCMDLVTLDGFLAALVVGPDTIMPSEWLPLVWGDPKGPAFETIDQVQETMNLIMRHMNSIIHVLMETPDDYDPILYKSKKGRKTYWVADDWCFGFMLGVALRSDSWKPLMDDKSILIMAPIMMFATEEGQNLIEKADDPYKMAEELVNQLGPAVRDIYEYWLPYRRRHAGILPGGVPAKKNSAVGRNGPCPCGSGKKYKLCCGNPNVS